MARKRFDHRGIRFSIRRNTAGYAWLEIPDGIARLDDPRFWGSVPLEFGPGKHECLAPVEWAQLGTKLGILDVMYERDTRVMSGLDIARRAFNRFRRLAEEITQWETVEGSWEEMSDECRPWSSNETSVSVLTADPDVSRRLIVDFANEFGTLWGDNDPRDLDAWISEASHFLALFDVARALRPDGDLKAFESCIRLGRKKLKWMPIDAPPGQLEYVSPRPFVQPMIIAQRGERIERRRARNALTQVTDYFEQALNGSPHQRARMLLHNEINRRLASGLDFNISRLDNRHSVVVPHHLAHLLYLRLWMDTVDGSDLEGERTCLSCGRELVGTRRKIFCDDGCRADYHNRRRARNQ